MGWINRMLERAIRNRIKLEEPDWIMAKIDREYAINRIHLEVRPLYDYIGKIKKKKSDALATILDFLTSYDLYDEEQIKNIRAESIKLSDL